MRNPTRWVALGAIAVAFVLPASASALTAGGAILRASSAMKTSHEASDLKPLPCPAGVPVQTITVVNNANVHPSALAKVERATTDQSMQVRAAWGTPCVQFGSGGWVFTLIRGTPTINPDGSVSYNISSHHYYNAGVVSATIQTAGTTYETWARAFTHEVAETLVDPTLSVTWKFGLLEICDPVANFTYDEDGVQVNDFALPSYFNAGVGPWDAAGALTGPFTAP